MSRPLSERLAEKPEDDTSRAPQGNQTHVRHDGWDIATLDDPGGDELAESIAPDVLIDSDGHENRTGYGFVGVNGVC